MHLHPPPRWCAVIVNLGCWLWECFFFFFFYVFFFFCPPSFSTNSAHYCAADSVFMEHSICLETEGGGEGWWQDTTLGLPIFLFPSLKALCALWDAAVHCQVWSVLNLLYIQLLILSFNTEKHCSNLCEWADVRFFFFLAIYFVLSLLLKKNWGKITPLKSFLLQAPQSIPLQLGLTKQAYDWNDKRNMKHCRVRMWRQFILLLITHITGTLCEWLLSRADVILKCFL